MDKQEIHLIIDQLPEEKLSEVKTFLATLLEEKFVEELPKSPLPGPGMSGKELLKISGTINKDDIALMKKAIEEGCENVDLKEW